jgi:hypothetical protein
MRRRRRRTRGHALKVSRKGHTRRRVTPLDTVVERAPIVEPAEGGDVMRWLRACVTAWLRRRRPAPPPRWRRVHRESHLVMRDVEASDLDRRPTGRRRAVAAAPPSEPMRKEAT